MAELTPSVRYIPPRCAGVATNAGVGRGLVPSSSAGVPVWPAGVILAPTRIAVSQLCLWVVELPERHHSHFFAFALGTCLYATLLLATE